MHKPESDLENEMHKILWDFYLTLILDIRVRSKPSMQNALILHSDPLYAEVQMYT